MKDYLLKTMQNHKPGLYLCELPTGNGKTYNCARAMKEYADQINDDTKIIYLTTLNKNLPEAELKAAYGNEEDYERNVLRIRSNFDEVVEKITEIEIPDAMKSETYKKLINKVVSYKKQLTNKARDKDYVKNLEDSIKDLDYIFRKEINKLLTDKFESRQSRKEGIKNDHDYQWISKLYPAVFTEDYKILLMSVSKFLKRNSILIDKSYEFINSDMIKDAIIIIDEFDATKETIQNSIIEEVLRVKEDYIALFNHLVNNLNVDNLSSEMLKAAKECASDNKIDSLINKGKDIYTRYRLNLSIKISNDNINKKQYFLFNDASFHTIFNSNEFYLRGKYDSEENRTKIFFEDKKTFYNNKESYIVIYTMLREINEFIMQMQRFIFAWGKKYAEIVNNSKEPKEDKMDDETGIINVLDILKLKGKDAEFMLNEKCRSLKKGKSKRFDMPDFYQKGMSYYAFEDNIKHNDHTIINYIKVYDTPEKILLCLSQNATIFGISASAEFNTVVGNYDLEYLKKELKDDFHSTPEYLKEKVAKELQARWKAYEEGKISIHSEVMNNNSAIEIEEYCNEFTSEGVADAFIRKTYSIEEYARLRYCNIFKAMCKFKQNDNIKSMLYLGMALAKDNDAKMDTTLFKELFDLAGKDTGKDNSVIYFLRGDDFDEDKVEIQKLLAEGKKIFVMSAYQTIGAGQNLQYEVPENLDVVYLGEYDENDNRYLNKDFDALYLGDITHLTVNTSNNAKMTEDALVKLLFQIEELYANDEISYEEKDEMIKIAFCAYRGDKNQMNKLYSLKSVNMQANRTLLQAVGRMCRTFVKSKDIYLFVESKLLNKLYIDELNKRILPPEMKSIIALYENTIINKCSEKECNYLYKAEHISTDSLNYIRRVLSQGWTQESINLWNDLRDVVLKYPTASSDVWESNDVINNFYITSGEKINQYLFSQYADFSNVVIQFSVDEEKFKKSNKPKIKGNSDEVIIYRMNEKESRLPVILKYEGMKEYFENKGYAKSFEKNDYLMNPVLFNNIYKGALGEVAGKFILEQELGIELLPIEEPEYFEFFDYKLCEGVYVDFKNWKYTYNVDKETIRKDISKKMNAINAIRVYVINVVGSDGFVASETNDGKLIEIPRLIDENGCIDKKQLAKIKVEDLQYVDK